MDDVMSTEDVAAAYKVSTRTVRAWRARRLAGDPEAGPPFYRIGDQCRYRRTEVEDWFVSQRAEPSAAAS
jgi:hypothetical protein